MSKRTKEVLNGPHEKIGVATLLPEDAAALLVRSADKARTLPVGSLARSKCIAQAVAKVRAMWPAFFKAQTTSESLGVSECGLSQGKDEGAGK